MSNKPIYVTRPSLPELSEFIPYLEKIWDSRILTNSGPFHQQLEEELAKFMDVPFVSLCANGTLALVVAQQALELTGEVITTPYSFVATTNSLMWNRLKPVFVDIEPEFCNLDPEKIVAAITPETSAIMPVHVYGNPCDVEKIKEIADVYGLKVIYDAAHAFGVKYKGQNLCNYGDLSVLSFHATKVFNTIEGGAIISHDATMKARIDHLRNFGFENETTIIAPGLNAKMNELQSALGLLQLQHHHENTEKRYNISQVYREELKSIRGLTLLPIKSDVIANHSYFPVFIDESMYGQNRDALCDHLKEQGVFSRRYFYPLISDFSIYTGAYSVSGQSFPVAELNADHVLCLPIYPDLEIEKVMQICDLIREAQRNI